MSLTLGAAVLAGTVVRMQEIEDPDQMRSVIDKAGPIAGLFVLALGIALFFLFRSMNKQIKRINPDLPEGPDDRLQAEDRRLTQEAVERGEESEQGPST